MDTTKDQAPEKPKSQQFAEAYQKLIEQFGYRITAEPKFLPRDDNTFSLVINLVIVETPQTPA